MGSKEERSKERRGSKPDRRQADYFDGAYMRKARHGMAILAEGGYQPRDTPEDPTPPIHLGSAAVRPDAVYGLRVLCKTSLGWESFAIDNLAIGDSATISDDCGAKVVIEIVRPQSGIPS
jgi:hypothetical protein